MIQSQTKLKVADNSGAKLAQCIRVLGGSKKRYAKLGDIVIVSVKQAIPTALVKKKTVARGVIVRQKQNFHRSDGSWIRFDENAIVLVNPDRSPKGSRILGPVARELKDKGFSKIISMAKEVV